MTNLISKFVAWWVYATFRGDEHSNERDNVLRSIARGHMDRYTEDNLPTTIDCLEESIRNAAKMEYNESVKRGDKLMQRLRIEDQITQLKKQLNEL